MSPPYFRFLMVVITGVLFSYLTEVRALAQSDNKFQQSSVLQGPTQVWDSKTGQVRAVLLCFHDIRLNGAAFEKFGQKISGLGFTCIAVDLPGFGVNQASKYVRTWNMDSAEQQLRPTLILFSKKWRNVPLVLIGEGFGSGICVRLANDCPKYVSGAVLINPGIAFSALEANSTNFSADRKVQEAILNNELTRKGAFTAAELEDLKKIDTELNNEVAKIDLPVLVLLGQSDSASQISNAKELYARINSKSKSLLELPNTNHLVLEYGLFSDKNIESISAWLDSIKVRDK